MKDLKKDSFSFNSISGLGNQVQSKEANSGQVSVEDILAPSKQHDSQLKQCCSKAEVLLVDDFVFNLMPLRVVIELQLNKLCDEAENGRIAVEMYRRNMEKTCCNVRYKIIFTDIEMPELDGVEELVQIKALEKQYRQANPSLNQVEVVMVSCYDDAELIQRCHKLGAIDYLTKPVNAEKIKSNCAKVFGRL